MLSVEYWQRFMQFEYANEVLLLVGGLCAVIAVLQIVRSSLKMLFWVVIGGLGLLAANIGMQQGAYALPGAEHWQNSRLNALASTLDEDVLKYLCQRFDTSDAQTLEAPSSR